MNPPAGSPWDAPETVAGFVRSPPNDVLLQYASARLDRGGRNCAIDIDCGQAGFAPDLAVPLREYNRSPSIPVADGPPVIYEAAFRRVPTS